MPARGVQRASEEGRDQLRLRLRRGAREGAGKGLWPAVWLLPDDHGWPEIDVMEILGDKPTETNMHYHFTKADGSLGDVGTAWTGPDFSAGWHTIGVDWQPGSLVWYVDGVERARHTGSEVTGKASYVLLNFAVGGTWPGSPDASTTFPAGYLSGISGSATDNLKVTKMTLLIDGVTKATGTTGSLSYNLSTRSVSQGAHSITVKAWDAAGNLGQSSTSYTR